MVGHMQILAVVCSFFCLLFYPTLFCTMTSNLSGEKSGKRGDISALVKQVKRPTKSLFWETAR